MSDLDSVIDYAKAHNGRMPPDVEAAARRALSRRRADEGEGDLSIAALQCMGENAGDGISPYVWGPALVNAAAQIERLQAELAWWRASFDGHVHVPDDEYEALCEEARKSDPHLRCLVRARRVNSRS